MTLKQTFTTSLLALATLISTTTAQTTSTASAAPAARTEQATIGACTYIGCYSDVRAALSSNQPNLTTLSYWQSQLNQSTITQELCVNTCYRGSFLYAGLEFGNQCLCGHGLNLPPSGATSGTYSCTDAAYACTGDQTEQCGGEAAIDVWFCPLPGATGTATIPTSVGSFPAATSTSSNPAGVIEMSANAATTTSMPSMPSAVGSSSSSYCSMRTSVVPVMVQQG
jgi:hypothetical protein